MLCCVEGSRPLLVEIQALVSRTHFGTPRRLATGVDPQRLALICAVLEKRLGVNLWDQDIYLNVVGGLQVDEPAADLAIAAAILSSLFNRPVIESTLIFGEIGLAGEVRPAMFPEIRLKEASMLGFRRGVIPRQAVSETATYGVELLRAGNLQEAQDSLVLASFRHFSYSYYFQLFIICPGLHSLNATQNYVTTLGVPMRGKETKTPQSLPRVSSDGQQANRATVWISWWCAPSLPSL